MERLQANWKNVANRPRPPYVCGFCGTQVAPTECFETDKSDTHIRLCSGCSRPTFFFDGGRVPGASPGAVVQHVPKSVAHVYAEARDCMSVGAYTGATLLLRKVLMNVAVANGAPENGSFVSYVEYLRDNHYLPPGGDSWVDKVRLKGNEATHEIPSIEEHDANELLGFAEMLLKFVYEFPGRLRSAEEATSDE